MWSLLFVAAALGLWVMSLGHVDLDAMNDYGLISVLPATYFIALIAIIASLCVVIHQDDAPEFVYVLHVLAIITIIHLSTPILYGTIRYSWTWKHIGIVDYILRHKSVNPAIHKLDAYHNWPGFFAVSALITQVAGQSSSQFLALWFEVVGNTLWFLGLLLILKTLTDDRRVIWFAVLFFVLTNWIGQDYYSPQAVAYFLYLVIVGICLRWFRSSLSLRLPNWPNMPRIQRIFDFASQMIERARDSAIHYEVTDPYIKAGLVGVLVVLSFTIVVTHQLTPVMLVGAVLLLVVVQQVNTKGLPVIVILLFLTWILYVADRFMGTNIASMVDSFGQVSGNVSNLIDLQTVSPGQAFVAVVGRVLTAGVWILGMAGGVRRLATKSVDIAAVLLTLVPAMIPFGNDYGGEILFRVYLFALPPIAFFAASFFYPTKEHGRKWPWAVAACVISVLAMFGFFYASFGKDQQYRFTQNEVDGATYLYTYAPDNSYLVEGNSNYPNNFLNYEYMDPESFNEEPADERARILADPASVFSDWMSNPRYDAAYLIITRSQMIASDTLGYFPPGGLNQIEQKLLASDRFLVIYRNPDVTIFVLNKQVTQPANQASP